MWLCGRLRRWVREAFRRPGVVECPECGRLDRPDPDLHDDLPLLAPYCAECRARIMFVFLTGRTFEDEGGGEQG